MSSTVTYYCDRKGCGAHSTLKDEFVFVRLQHSNSTDELIFCSKLCLHMWVEEEAARMVARGQ